MLQRLRWCLSLVCCTCFDLSPCVTCTYKLQIYTFLWSRGRGSRTNLYLIDLLEWDGALFRDMGRYWNFKSKYCKKYSLPKKVHLLVSYNLELLLGRSLSRQYTPLKIKISNDFTLYLAHCKHSILDLWSLNWFHGNKSLLLLSSWFVLQILNNNMSKVV